MSKYGWHANKLTAYDIILDNDLTITGDLSFGNAVTDTFTCTGDANFGAYGIDITSDVTYRALRIGVKGTPLKISTGSTVDAEPANNYLFGLFSKVSVAEATSTDELRSAWIRTQVNNACTIGTATGWGYGVCGAEIQLKVLGATVNSWQASTLWAQLETSGATTTFASGCIASCVLANVGLTATTTIANGGVVAGVTINSNTAASGVTATGGFYGLYITQKTAGLLDFTSGIYIAADSCTSGIDVNAATGIDVGTCTTGILFTGTTYATAAIGVGVNDWAGGTSITIPATSPLVQVLGKVSSDTGAGMYACSYNQLAILATQTHGISEAASWNELYILGGTIALTGTDNHYAVWGNVIATGTVTGGTGNVAALCGSLTIPAGYTNPSGGMIAGCIVDAIIHTTMTNTGDTAAYTIGTHTDPNQGDWEYGFYIPSGTCTAGFVMGEKSSNSAIGHHIGVANSADSAGDKAIAVFADDNNATLATDAQGINSRCLILHAQAGSYAMDALRGHLRGVASVTPNAQKSFSATSGYVEFSGTYTIGDATNIVFM